MIIVSIIQRSTDRMSEVMEADVPFPNNKIMIGELIIYTYPNTNLSLPAEKSHTCFIFVPPREGKGDSP